MSFGLYIKKQRSLYQREFFTENKNTNEIPYHGIINIDEHDSFSIEKLNTLKLFKEKSKRSSGGYELKCSLPYICGRKTIIELIESELIVDLNPFKDFMEIKLTPGIEKIIRNSFSEEDNIKKFGRFLVKKGVLLSK